MKLGFGIKLAALALLGMGSSLANPARAAQFDQQEVNQRNFIAIAAPVAGGAAHQLLILEQINNSRPCWRETGDSPRTVEPLLINFDFTGICGRSTDSNGYSVRVDGQDLASQYRLRVVHRQNDLVLVASPFGNPNSPALEIGRAHGLSSDFTQIALDPGWRITKRTYNGQALGHVYLTNDQDLPSLIAAASNPDTEPSRPPVVSRPVASQPTPAQPRPTQPRPTTPTPATPPVVSGDDADSLAEVIDYRVVVRSRGRAELDQVRTVVPDAFLIAIRGRDYVQAGVFRDRTTAEQRRQQLRQADLNARVVTVLPDQSTTANRPTSRPPTTRPTTPSTTPSRPTTQPTTPSRPTTPTGSTTDSTIGSTFNLPEPSQAALSRGQNLWATYYLVHQTTTASNGYPLLDMSGRSLGVTLSQRDWCAAALQGTVLVANGQQGGTYNFAGRGDSEQVDCSRFYPGLANIRDTNRVRFTPARGAYGDGVDGLALTPYRSIAVDRNQIPIGSVVYIPEARGQRITLPNGETVVHDGYFFAADVGHAVQGNHVDMFIGTAERNPFAFATSRESDTFTAYIVNDFQIRQTLEAMHRRSSGVAVR